MLLTVEEKTKLLEILNLKHQTVSQWLKEKVNELFEESVEESAKIPDSSESPEGEKPKVESEKPKEKETPKVKDSSESPEREKQKAEPYPDLDSWIKAMEGNKDDEQEALSWLQTKNQKNETVPFDPFLSSRYTYLMLHSGNPDDTAKALKWLKDRRHQKHD